MAFRSVIEPETIAMLTGVLDRHCAKFGIRSHEGRESVACSILKLYRHGISDPETIAKMVEEEDRPD